MGWMGYDALADVNQVLLEMDERIRHRLRMCVWKQRKRVRTRIREIRAHGAPEWMALAYANTRKGPWAASLLLTSVLTKDYRQELGLVNLMDRYLEVRSAWRTAIYGTVRRWCERTAGNPCLYSLLNHFTECDAQSLTKMSYILLYHKHKYIAYMSWCHKCRM